MSRAKEQYPPAIHNILVKERELKWNDDGFLILSPEDYEFWGSFPPDRIEVATASIRKAFMYAVELNGFVPAGMKEHRHQDVEQDNLIKKGKKRYGKEGEGIKDAQYFSNRKTLPQPGKSEHPFDLEAYFNKYIFNGNGSLKRKTLLGYLHGVPVYAVPQNGETGSNSDPVAESTRKVESVAKKRRNKNKNVLIIGIDTVDRPSTADDNLGKVMYLDCFPKDKPFADDDAFVQATVEFSALKAKLLPQNKIKLLEEIELCAPRRDGFSSEQLPEAIDAFKKIYKEAYYRPGTVITHTNAIVILDALSGEILNPDETKALLRLVIDEEVAANLEIKIDAGGGGASQQVPNYHRAKTEARRMGNDLTKEALLSQDRSIVYWALYCQFAGMPYYPIKTLLSKTKDSPTRQQAVTKLMEKRQRQKQKAA